MFFASRLEEMPSRACLHKVSKIRSVLVSGDTTDLVVQGTTD